MSNHSPHRRSDCQQRAHAHGAQPPEEPLYGPFTDGRVFGRDPLPQSVQEFLHDAAWSNQMGAALAITPRGITDHTCAIVVPPGEPQLAGVFIWRALLSDRRFKRSAYHARGEWATHPAQPGINAMARLDIQFQAPERFAYRIAVPVDQGNHYHMHLIANGARLLLTLPATVNNQPIPTGKTPPAGWLPITTQPSPHLHTLLDTITGEAHAA